MHDWVAEISVVGAFVTGCVMWYFLSRAQKEERELRHAERMAAIEKGRDLTLDPLEINPPAVPGNSLKTGLVCLLTGLCLAVCMRIGVPASGHWIWGAALAALGAAHLVYWFAGGREEWREAKRLEREFMAVQIGRLSK